MKEYLKAQNKTNEAVLENTYSPDELNRFSKSDYRWADNRTKPFRHRIVKKGEIYQSDMFLLKNSEFSFITHDSVLKLNDIRTVSVNRILYQQSGRIPPSSDTYKQIKKLVLQKYFPSFYHDYEQNIQVAASLNGQLKETVNHNNVLKAENKLLKVELESLKNQISASRTD